MNLLLLTSSFPLNPDDGQASAGLFVADLARLLSEDDHQVDVATPDKHGEKGNWRGFTVHWLPWSGGSRPLSQIRLHDPREWLGIATLVWQTPRHVAAICRQRQIEAVIAMWAVPAGWWARYLKQTMGLPYVTWCLGSDIWSFGRIPVLRFVVRTVLRASDGVFADGLELARETQLLSGRSCSFLASSRVLDPGLATLVATGGRRPLFFFVGRYAPVKGVDVLLEAMAIYVQRGGTGELVMRGGGPLEGSIRKRAADSELCGRVTVGGYADQSTTVSHLAACDVQIIPSRQESIPVAYSDGLQMGRPLIVTDVGDMGSLMRRQQAGIVVPPEDADALATAMLSFDAGGTERYRDAVQAAAREFDLRNSARTLVGLLESVRSRRPAETSR